MKREEGGREGGAEFDKTLNSHLLDTRGDQSCKEVDGGGDDKRYLGK